MFANLTEETCTGTGNVLTLLGATPGMRPYNRGFDDGALAAYVVKDGDGVVTASGIGTFTAPNQLLRNDSENDNGTITDKNPVTNITLSAGTHTVTCDAVSYRLNDYQSAHDVTILGTPMVLPIADQSSGQKYASDKTVNVSPLANSTLQFTMRKQKVDFNSIFNVESGGWLGVDSPEVTTAGTGTIDKIVIRNPKVTLEGGNINVAIMDEPSIGGLGVTTLVENLIMQYIPDLSAVPNISNVQNFWSWACDHYLSKTRNAGQHLKTINPLAGSTITQEIAPMHGGVVTGRYYFPYSAKAPLAGAALIAGVRYYVPFVVPTRKTYIEIGARVIGAVASSNMRLGIHHSVNGVATDLIVDSGDIATATVGAKIAVINETLEAGFYWLTIQASAAISINHCEIAQLMTLAGSTSDDLLEIAPYAGPVAYGALPNPATGINYSTQTNLPAIWLRS